MTFEYKGETYTIISNQTKIEQVVYDFCERRGKNSQWRKQTLHTIAKEFLKKGKIFAIKDNESFLFTVAEINNPDIEAEILDVVAPDDVEMVLTLIKERDAINEAQYGASDKYSRYDWTYEAIIPYLVQMRCFNKRKKDFPELSLNQWRGLLGKYAVLIYPTRTPSILKQSLVDLQIQLQKKKERYEMYLQKLAHPEYYPNMPYGVYLMTEHWQQLRQLVFERDCGVCTKCGSVMNLHTHHKSYNNMWIPEKEIDDLILLCKDCHSFVHGL